MIIDFRRQEHSHGETFIRDQEAEVVIKYKYLGTIFDDKLNWDVNTEAVLGKGQKWVYLLRKLKSFSRDETNLTLFSLSLSLFYKLFFESILS